MTKKLLALTLTLVFTVSAFAQTAPPCGHMGSPGYCGGGGITAYDPLSDAEEFGIYLLTNF